MSPTTHTLLLIEDNEDDVFLMHRALRAANVHWPVQLVQDGEEAMDYLKGVDKFAAREQFPLPTVVLLDLKLPFIPGLEVLAWVRENPALKDLPVIVLTSSPEDRDREQAAELNAIGYHLKPPKADFITDLNTALQQVAASTPK